MEDLDQRRIFDETYKKLRNGLKSLRRDDFVLNLIHTLRKDEGIPFDEYAKGKPMPWTMLTLLSLACLYCGGNVDVKKAEEKDFVMLYNFAYDLEGKYSVVILKENFHGFFLLLCHQQFWHQREIIRSAFARVDYIFCSCEQKDIINSWFENIIGIPAKIFTELLIATWTVFKINNHFSCNLEKQLAVFGYGESIINKFLKHASVDIDDVQAFVQSRPSPVKNYFFQFGERTPFIFRPIIKAYDGGHVLISLRLLERTISTYIFEMVKKSGDEAVIKAFADAFENYCSRLIECAHIDSWCKHDLEDAFIGKSTDFMFQSDEKTVFLECKSTRLSPIAVANPEHKILLSDIKDSICKAILQAYELAVEINKRCESIEPYVIVVTYEDMFFGEPQRNWDILLRDYFEHKYPHLHVAEVIPPNRIFIIGVQEFEQLCEYCKGNAWISALLNKALEDNATPSTAKHSLLMHVESNEKRNNIPFITSHFHDIFKRLSAKLPRN
ncbi:MAG: hypothetical protein RDU24_03235 [Humidesulfovibrio sp.]|uniref:hypothetical protein n=1 Tax=Humidesulfovibrio sp. TaxID=2910988 RepID=UPI0027E8754B|nr:hypothetical protein [Humidesulfovibrio sp.]MDQ7834374.1 hypothetical protein [Humidesulfovibrio sp.]